MTTEEKAVLWQVEQELGEMDKVIQTAFTKDRYDAETLAKVERRIWRCQGLIRQFSVGSFPQERDEGPA